MSAYVWPSFASYRMRAVLSLMVMPRSRSRSMPSRYWACAVRTTASARHAGKGLVRRARPWRRPSQPPTHVRHGRALAPSARLHVSILHRVRLDQQLVGERGLAVVDVGDDGKVADALGGHLPSGVGRQSARGWGGGGREGWLQPLPAAARTRAPSNYPLPRCDCCGCCCCRGPRVDPPTRAAARRPPPASP